MSTGFRPLNNMRLNLTGFDFPTTIDVFPETTTTVFQNVTIYGGLGNITILCKSPNCFDGNPAIYGGKSDTIKLLCNGTDSCVEGTISAEDSENLLIEVMNGGSFGSNETSFITLYGPNDPATQNVGLQGNLRL